MEVKQALEESVKHWERMIEWAVENGDMYILDREFMKHGIGEDWYGGSCPLCNLYADTHGFTVCAPCPIGKTGLRCGRHRSAWRAVACSKSWAEWIKNAKGMLKLLNQLLAEEIKNNA